ncbi:MAG: Mu transposase C-terminal domain-containing protein [Acidobacteriia bacterium]|nr:Mu transposase C-terminal domain-containing protein [Terriglobia bacterium]
MSAELWLSKERVCELEGWTSRTAEAKAKGSQLRWRYAESKRRNGRRPREYAISTLTPAAQMKYFEQQQRPAVSTALVPVNANQPTLFEGVPVLDPKALTNLNREQEAEVREVFAIISPMLQWADGYRPHFTLPSGAEVHNMEDLASYLGGLYGKSRSTMWNYYNAWRKQGPRGLLRNRRNDSGIPRYWGEDGEHHPHAAKFVLAKYAELGATAANGAPNLRLIYDSLIREWGNLSENGDPPAYSTVRSLVAKIPPVMRDAARLTRQAHDARHAPYLTRAIERVRPLEVFVADHRIYDVLIYNDCFDTLPANAAFRPWETACEDLRTRVIVGSVWAATPSGRTIARAYMRGIEQFGKPETAYVDNGKDFRSVGGAYGRAPRTLDEHGRVPIDLSAQHLFGRLGIKVTYCIPRHPQSKQIESYFSTVSKRFDVLFGDGYAGRKPSARSDACREAEQLHKEWLAGKRPKSPFVPASYFFQLHRQWVLEFNATHCHTGRGMDGRAPLDVMNELLPAEQRKIPSDLEQFEWLFWDREDRVVRNCRIELGNHTYTGADESAMQALYLVNHERISVARDPDDVGCAIAFDDDGKPLALLHSQELTEHGPISADKIKAISRFRNRSYRELQQAWLMVQSGVPTEIEMLAQRAGAPPQPSPQILPPRPRAMMAAPSAAPTYVEDDAREVLALMKGN